MHSSRLRIICDPAFAEILMAEVAEAGFDTFLETETGFEAYVEGDAFDQQLLDVIQEKYRHVKPLLFFRDKIEKKNWNEEWEKNVQPIVVDDQCLVRAAFHHIEKKYPYEIIITPKMSFGTGHHPTTHLMLSRQLRIDHQGKRVMDAGCGTAILSIMACKRGARQVEAFDIDAWSVENAVENVQINGCNKIRIQKGKIDELLPDGHFDIILANINKNILLEEMKWYAGYLAGGGLLLLSGFYVRDLADLRGEAGRHHLKALAHDERETWACLLLEKQL